MGWGRGRETEMETGRWRDTEEGERQRAGEKDPESETDGEGGKGALEALEASDGDQEAAHVAAQGRLASLWPGPLPVWLVTHPSVASSFRVNVATPPLSVVIGLPRPSEYAAHSSRTTLPLPCPQPRAGPPPPALSARPERPPRRPSCWSLRPGSSTVTRSLAEVKSRVEAISDGRSPGFGAACLSRLRPPGGRHRPEDWQGPSAECRCLPARRAGGGPLKLPFYRVSQVMGCSGGGMRNQGGELQTPPPTPGLILHPHTTLRASGPCPAGRSSHVSCPKQGWASLATHLTHYHSDCPKQQRWSRLAEAVGAEEEAV